MSVPSPDSSSPPDFTFHCPHCTTALRIPHAMGGMKGPCPQCALEITVPMPKAAPIELPTPFGGASRAPATAERTVVLAPPIPPPPGGMKLRPLPGANLVGARGAAAAAAAPVAPPPVASPSPPPPRERTFVEPSNFGPPAPLPSTESANRDPEPERTAEGPSPDLRPYQPPQEQLVLQHRKPARHWGPRSVTALSVAALVLLLGLGWWVAAFFGAAPEVGAVGARQLWEKVCPPPPVIVAKPVRISSDAWNLVLDAPSMDWFSLHPGGNNGLGVIANFSDPDGPILLNCTVHGTMSLESTDPKAGIPESFERYCFRMGASYMASEQNLAATEREIGGRKFLFIKQDLEQSPGVFRPSPVSLHIYELIENHTAYNFLFIGKGSHANERLNVEAERILKTVRPLVKNLAFSTLNNLTTSDPLMLAGETGLGLPRPGPAWDIIPDAPTLFAALGSASQTRSYVATAAEARTRPIASGSLGAPSVGYQTSQGDLCGLSVFHLPEELKVEPAHLADLILAAWFPNTSVDRQNERPFHASDLTGVEYSGQISRELNPGPFLFRLLRRGEMVYALGAASFSEKYSSEDLTKALDAAVWSAPRNDLQILSPRYTPPVCLALWEHIINSLGQEKQQANQLLQAADLYEQAYATHASYPILMAFCDCLAKLNQPERASAMLEQEWRKLPAQANFLGRAACFQAHHGKLDQATALMTTALQMSAHNDFALTYDLIQDYLVELRDAHAKDETLRVLDLLNSRAPSNEWRLWEAYILYSNPETKPQGLTIMEGLITGVRRNRELARDMLRFLKEHKAYPLGLEAAQVVLHLNVHDGMAWLLRATCERSLGDDQKAAATLAKAREYNPNLRDLDELAYSITDDEGGPVLSENGPQAPPINLPADVLRLLKTEPYATTPKTEDPYQYLYRIRSVTYDPGSPYTMTNRYSIRIQNAGGMETFNILKLPYHPRGERIQVNDLHVRTPDGKTIAPANMRDAFITEDNADGMSTGMRVLNVPVPGLAPGCILEYTVTELSLGVVAGPLTTSFHFATDMPCALDILYIHSPVAKIEYRHSTGTKPLKIPTGLVWVERTQPGISYELHQPSLEKFVPVLWTGDGGESWARLGHEYLSLIQHKLKPDETITKLAKEKTKNCTTDAERIAILSSYVRDTLSYAAIEFGMRGLIPNTANESIKNRYGDCKDHSVLMYQLLRAVGIPAKLVLANASTAVQPDLPALGAFNHMITAIPAATKGEYDYIDCTNKYMAPKFGVPPLHLAGKFVLVLGEASNELSAESSKLIKICAIPEGSETVKIERTAQVIDQRNLAMKESISLTGLSACEMRYHLGKTTERRDSKAAIQRLLGINRAQSNVTLAKVENLSDLEKPLIINLEYEVKNACSKLGQSLSARLPNLSVLRFLDPDTVGETRHSPFEFASPLQLTLHTKLYGPAGMALTPTATEPTEQRFVRWSASQTSSDGRSDLTLNLTRRTGIFPAADYADFQSQINDAAGAVEEATLIPSTGGAKELTTRAHP